MTADDSSQPAKGIETLVLDTGPLIKGVCSPTSLLEKSSNLVTVPGVAREIRDAATCSRFETLWSPFLQYRSPKPASIKYISDFAKKTGDYGVLGATDLQVLALTYEIECEAVGGAEEFSKRLEERKAEILKKESSGKKGKRRGKKQNRGKSEASLQGGEGDAPQGEEDDGWTTIPVSRRNRKDPAIAIRKPDAPQLDEKPAAEEPQTLAVTANDANAVEQDPQPQSVEPVPDEPVPDEPVVVIESDNDDDGDDWITPDNLAVHLTSDGTISTPATKEAAVTTACCTSDFAMQNVLLQLHIQLFSPATMSRITSVKSHVLRCHACFKVVRDGTRQFCPSCGQPALTKVTCSTDANGVFRIHLKKNWQWNNRGNVFSMAKPQHGTPSMKGVRENIVLSEDQKEYEKAVKESKRVKERDLMDQDYLPGLLTGERLGHGGNPKIGAGRNINASKRR
ncbi:Nin1 binding protein [Orbilia brochopaga]|uniref:20S-pre-rRNA D-site endonuclease NOB1 n=1 Tax=Orbilia brochopaga TaxID=3140254 RepID=A0AAV9V6X1_9PEZI